MASDLGTIFLLSVDLEEEVKVFQAGMCGRECWSGDIEPMRQKVQVKEESNLVSFDWPGNETSASQMLLHDEINTSVFSELRKTRKCSEPFLKAKFILLKFLSFFLRLCSFLFLV